MIKEPPDEVDVMDEIAKLIILISRHASKPTIYKQLEIVIDTVNEVDGHD